MTAPRTTSIPQALELAVTHHRAGRLTEARAIYREVLDAVPEHFDALHLLGVVEHQERRYASAVELIQRAVSRKPADAGAQNHLGDAYVELGDLTRARACYEAAIAADPRHAEAHNGLGITYEREGRVEEAAHCFGRAAAANLWWAVPRFNLGLCLSKRGALAEAAEQFGAAWKLDPGMLAAARECVDAVAELARAGPLPSDHASKPMPAPTHSTSIVFCSIDDRKCARTAAMYERLFAGTPHELIAIRDARSLAEAYNRGVAASRGDVILLSHDDIDVLVPDFAARLHEHLRTFDALGVMGATQMSGPGWTWSRHPHLRGWITHRAPEEDGWYASVVDPRPVAGDIVVLDGVFMAARRSVFDEVPFDDETFDGFHLYDIDWSYRAAEAGFRLGVAGDLGIVHESRGRFGEEWARYAECFCDKHCLDDLPPPPPSQLFEARFETIEQLRSFFDRLTHLET